MTAIGSLAARGNARTPPRKVWEVTTEMKSLLNAFKTYSHSELLRCSSLRRASVVHCGRRPSGESKGGVMWTICACGKFLLVPTRCFAAAQGRSWLRRTLTHHPSAGYCRLSFDSRGQPTAAVWVTKFRILARIFGFSPLPFVYGSYLFRFCEL